MSTPVAGAARPLAAAPLAPLVLLLVVGGLLGLFTVLLEAGIAAGWHPLALLFWTLSGAGLALAGYAAAKGHRPRRDPAALAYYLGMGLLNIALPNILSGTAIVHVGASFVALCYAFPPLVTYGLALGLGIERPRLRRAAGLLLALAGAILLVAAKLSLGDAGLAWLAMALAAPVLIGAGNIFRSIAWPKGAAPLSLAPGALLAGALILPAYALGAGAPLAPPAGGAALLLLLAGTAVFAAISGLIFTLQALAGPVYLGQVGSVGAAAGALLAAAVLGEAASPAMVVATAVVLAGVFLVNRSR